VCTQMTVTVQQQLISDRDLAQMQIRQANSGGTQFKWLLRTSDASQKAKNYLGT